MNELGEGPVEGLVRLCLLNTPEFHGHSQLQPLTIYITVFPAWYDHTEAITILTYWYCSHFTDMETDLGQRHHLPRVTVDTWSMWSYRSPAPNPHTAFRRCKPAFRRLPSPLGFPNCASMSFSVEK